jgi:hypothetical protein
MQINKNVEREVFIHSQINHPNVIGFKKVRAKQSLHGVTHAGFTPALQVLLAQ